MRQSDAPGGVFRRRPIAVALAVVLSLLALFQVARGIVGLVAFPDNGRYLPYTRAPGILRHNCLSSYLVADQLARDGAENIYDHSHYAGRKLEQFDVHRFTYPPTSLVPVRLIGAISPSYSVTRGIWAAWWLACFVAAYVLLARWSDKAGARRELFLLPVLLGLPAMVWHAERAQNYHGIVVSLAVLGMFAFERRRPAVGAVLLASATLIKIYPGILAIHFVAQRRWRELGYLAAAALALAALTVAVIGIGPIRSFFDYQLPMLASGRAFDEWAGVKAVALSDLSFGKLVVGKLEGFSLVDAGVANTISGVLNKVYLLGLAGLVYYLARRREESSVVATRCLGLLGLASLAAPMVPFYGVLVPLWAGTKLLAESWGHRRRMIGLGLVCVILGFGCALCVMTIRPFLPSPGPPSGGTRSAFVMAPFLVSATAIQIACYGILLWAVFRRPQVRGNA